MWFKFSGVLKSELTVRHSFRCALCLKRNVKRVVQWNIFQWSEHVWWIYIGNWSWYGHNGSKMGSQPRWTETHGNTSLIPSCTCDNSRLQLLWTISKVLLTFSFQFFLHIGASPDNPAFRRSFYQKEYTYLFSISMWLTLVRSLQILVILKSEKSESSIGC